MRLVDQDLDGRLQLALALPVRLHEKAKQWQEIGESIGQPNILQEIKAAYASSTASLLPLLRDGAGHVNSATAPDLIQSLIQACHKLKSGSGTLGFVRLQALCE